LAKRRSVRNSRLKPTFAIWRHVSSRAYVFVAVERANSEVAGIHAARSANRLEALEPLRQDVHRRFGAIASGVALHLNGVCQIALNSANVGLRAI